MMSARKIFLGGRSVGPSTYQFIDSLSERCMENPGSDILEHGKEGKGG